ncbi:MAG: YitT family protein, partial [Flavobacteriales bacterium]
MKRISIQNIIRRLIIYTVLRYKHHSKGTSRDYTPMEMAKGFREFKINTWTSLKDIMLNIVGIFSAAFGLESFLLPTGFIDGGATGISLLVAKLMDMPVPLLLILVNVPFVIFGYNIISKQFAWRASLSIIGLAIVVALCHFPEVTNDRLLVSVFGGFFLGVGIGLSMRGGAVLDGTEVIAISISRKVGLTVGDIILLINILIFGTAAYLLSVETALYSILTYLSASKTVDF